MKESICFITSVVRLPAPHLYPLQQALAQARTNKGRRKAAMAILHAYSRHYSIPLVPAQIKQLTCATTTIHCIPVLNSKERHRVMMFCEFTLLMIEASCILINIKRQSDRIRNPKVLILSGLVD